MGLVGVGGDLGSRAVLPLSPLPSSGKSRARVALWVAGVAVREMVSFRGLLIGCAYLPPPVRELTLDILG